MHADGLENRRGALIILEKQSLGQSAAYQNKSFAYGPEATPTMSIETFPFSSTSLACRTRYAHQPRRFR